MASSPLIVEDRLSPSNLFVPRLRTGSDDGTHAATGMFGRRDRASRSAVPPAQLAIPQGWKRKLVRPGPKRWPWSGRKPSRPKPLDIRRPIQGHAVAAQGLRLLRRVDGVRAEPAARGLLRSSRG